MLTGPFTDVALVKGALYATAARLAIRTRALHAAEDHRRGCHYHDRRPRRAVCARHAGGV